MFDLLGTVTVLRPRIEHQFQAEPVAQDTGKYDHGRGWSGAAAGRVRGGQREAGADRRRAQHPLAEAARRGDA
jgi:hypothetical protein